MRDVVVDDVRVVAVLLRVDVLLGKQFQHILDPAVLKLQHKSNGMKKIPPNRLIFCLLILACSQNLSSKRKQDLNGRNAQARNLQLILSH